MKLKRIIFVLAAVLLGTRTYAQQYAGMTGMVHIPTAEMNKAGDIRVGASFLNGELLPDAMNAQKSRMIFGDWDGEKYNTAGFYLNITPFKWVELSYNVVLMKRIHYTSASGDKGATYEGDGLAEKDQFISFKIRPIEEKDGKWWPSVAIGGTDFFDSHGGDEMYFGNVWAVATKTFKLGPTDRNGYNHQLGVTLGYRYFFNKDNEKWRGYKHLRGIFAGVSYRPSFYNPLRFTLEWTGHEVVLGADCLLWNHLLLQASLANGKHPTAGVAYQLNLLGVKKALKEKKQKKNLDKLSANK